MEVKENNYVQKQGLRQRLIVISGMILIVPFLVVSFILAEHNITLPPTHILLFFLIVALVIVGITFTRYIFEDISSTAEVLKNVAEGGGALSLNLRHEVAELNIISLSLNQVMERFEKTTESLNQAKESLKESEELYKTLSEKSFAGIYVVQEGVFKFINTKAASYAGYLPEEMIGKKSDFIVHPEDRGDVRMKAREMLHSHRSSPYEFRIVTSQGRIRWIMETVTPITFKGTPAVLGNSMDISERKEHEEEIHTLSVTDQLTGLYNRRGFMALAEQQLKIANRAKTKLLLLFADLDDMKGINDTMGHKRGDEALVEAATILKEVFRDSDVIARIGGDEFAVLAIVRPQENSEPIKGRLQNSIDAHNFRKNQGYHLSMSIGMIEYDPETQPSIDELMARADERMYEQKRNKRNGKDTS